MSAVSIRSVGAAAFAAMLASFFLPEPARAADPFESAERCGECHRDIHRGWKKSAHAQSLEDPVFQQALQAAGNSLGAADRKLCFSCHAPTTLLSGDYALQKKVTWEGVNCDFCHSITAVTLGDPMTAYTTKPGPVQRGPIENAASNGHEVEYSALFTDALLCAGCHEYRPEGAEAVLTTYSEWKESPYEAEGVTCQSCHMSLVRANVVDPKIQRVSSSNVNLHEVPGGHSLDQLLTAVRVGLDAQRAADSLTVTVKLANVGAGHSMPTGFPSRSVVLEVQVASAGRQLRAERRFERTLFDAAGAPITGDVDVITKPASSATDTRLRPREERVERFTFPMEESSSATVTARLRYVHMPLRGEPPASDQVFYSERRFVKAR